MGLGFRGSFRIWGGQFRQLMKAILPKGATEEREATLANDGNYSILLSVP